jgi:hypothetical protein
MITPIEVNELKIASNNIFKRVEAFKCRREICLASTLMMSLLNNLFTLQKSTFAFIVCCNISAKLPEVVVGTHRCATLALDRINATRA